MALPMFFFFPAPRRCGALCAPVFACLWERAVCLEGQKQNLPSPSFPGLLFPVNLSTLGGGGQVTEGAKRRSKERELMLQDQKGTQVCRL